MSDEFTQYDDARRRGVFDKCNGRAPAHMRDEDDAWICAYFDGYDANESKFGEPELEVEFEPEGNVYKLWMEGDWGQDELIFGSEESAKARATELIKDQLPEPQDDDWTCYEDAEKGGLAGIQELTFIP